MGAASRFRRAGEKPWKGAKGCPLMEMELARQCAADLNSEGGSAAHLPRYESKNQPLLSFKNSHFVFSYCECVFNQSRLDCKK